METRAVAARLVRRALVTAVIATTAPTATSSLELGLAILTARRRASEPVIGRSVERPRVGTAPSMEYESKTTVTLRSVIVGRLRRLAIRLRLPALNLGTEPEFRAPIAEIAHRAGHVGIAMLVDAHRVAMGESEHIGHAIRI